MSNVKPLALAALVLSLGASCGAPLAGPITFAWTFGPNNLSCSSAGIATVAVTVHGIAQTLPCTSSAGDQGTFTAASFVADQALDFTLAAFTAADTTTAVYTASGNFTADPAGAPNDLSVDLTAVAGPVGPVTFDWTFSSLGLTCEQAQVFAVNIQGQGLNVTLPCTSSTGDQGTVTGASGTSGDTLQFTLTGISYTYDDNGNVNGQANTYQDAVAVVSDSAGGTTVEPVQLPTTAPLVNSSIVFLWDFAGQTCAQIGSPTLALTIIDPVNGNVNVTVPCDQNGTDGVRVTNFEQGAFPFTVTATVGATTYYAAGTAYTNDVTDTVVRVSLDDVTQASSGTGTLTVNVGFGNSAGTCDAAGLDHVETYLTDDTGAVVSGSVSTVACSAFGGSVTYSGLTAPATYFLFVDGIANGVATYVLPQFGVSVYPDGTSTYTVDVPAMSI